MRKSLLLVVASVCLLTFSCKKIDFPLPKKLCQIKKITRQGGPTISGTFDYFYDSQRMATHTTIGIPYPVVRYTYEYDNNDRLITVFEKFLFPDSTTSPTNKLKLIYHGGLVTRIDLTDMSDQLLDQSFLTYDHKKRLIQRINFSNGFGAVLQYEYEGNSRNPRRKILGTPANPATTKTTLGLSTLIAIDTFAYYEYEYDNKINPQQTLVGWPLSAVYWGVENTPIDLFEPIPENNIIYQRFMGSTGNGTFFNYKEFFITFQYNHHYPVSENHRTVNHFTSGAPPTESFATATYEYECKN